MGAAQYAETILGADSSPYDGLRARRPSQAAVDHRRTANSEPRNEFAGPDDAKPGSDATSHTDPDTHADHDAEPNSDANSDANSGAEFADAGTDREHAVTDGVTRFGGGLLCGGWCPGGLCGMGAR